MRGSEVSIGAAAAAAAACLQLRPGYLNDEGTIQRLIKEQEELDYDELN